MGDAGIYAHLVAEAYVQTSYAFGAKDEAARGSISQVDGRRILSVPGTDNLACWLADLRAVAKSTTLGVIHEGFDDALQTILPGIIEYAPVELCGHSEGADLCLLAAGYCCLAGKSPKRVWAFEPARLCVDWTLADILEAHGVEVIITNHGRDVVPLVPRILHDWRHPVRGEIRSFGTASWPVVNVDDHYLDDRFIRELKASGI